MHFSTFIATTAAVSGALASYYEEPVYYTSAEAVYTSIKTCSEGYAAPTSEAVYAAPTTAAPAPYGSSPAEYGPVSEVTYTSYTKITVTSCGDYVTNCPAATYTSAAYSVSTCTGESPSYYVPAVNSTAVYYTAPYETPAPYGSETPVPAPYETSTPCPSETPVPVPTYTNTYYTTVCPGKDYCYATTVTSTYCPGTPVPVPTYTPVPPPVYTTAVVPSCPGGYNCPTPPKNETTPVYTPPPSYTGAASANAVSYGVAAVAGLAALFIAA